MRYRGALPIAGALFVVTTLESWRTLRFVGGLAVIVVVAKLAYNEIEDRLEWRGRTRRMKTDVAELIERWSFPTDTAQQVCARLRGMSIEEVGDAVAISRREREEFERRMARHGHRRAS